MLIVPSLFLMTFVLYQLLPLAISGWLLIMPTRTAAANFQIRRLKTQPALNSAKRY